MNVTEILSKIQAELKAPKNKWNEFGGYFSRSAEDILEAVKPLCQKYNAVIYLSDEVEEHQQGDYIKTTATLQEFEQNTIMSATALARIPKEKKKLDDSQLTGSASSYARKYALCGLLGIDDNKDAELLPPEKPQNSKDTSAAPICVRCGKPIKGVRTKSAIIPMDEVAKNCGGMCYNCYKQSKQ